MVSCPRHGVKAFTQSITRHQDLPRRDAPERLRSANERGLQRVENYIIRIYRQDRKKPRLLVGTIEEVGQEGKKAFTNYDELWDILNPPAGKDIYVEDTGRGARPLTGRKSKSE